MASHALIAPVAAHSAGASGRSIRTPDQRLRVFVSSTLKELAAERKAARAAIERLRLAPVMFELGARPHPPRSLYRAYLEQSDVFVGLYGVSYGWVAPDENVSGLEDEYNLAPATMPKLIYIVETADARDPRLARLIDRIREDDTASYSYIVSPDELEQRLEADLATLLAERFDQSRVARAPRHDPEPVEPVGLTLGYLPAQLTELIGRDREIAAISELLSRDAVRLVTLIGPGGIGKSRLAIEVARRAAEARPESVAFVDLSPARDRALVVASIARVIGVRDTGDRPLEEKLIPALRDRRMLIVLDNFEQVVGAAPVLRELLAVAPRLSFLVTSRTLLRISGEHAFEVEPLPLPDDGRDGGVDAAAGNPSVELFVERARAIKPDFELTPANVAAITRICVALDGVPLALELAAARVRLLPPAAMLARLDRRLPLLADGLQDLPERQRTLRNTIEWSTDLLGADERRLLFVLAVFVGEFSLDAAESVVRSAGESLDVFSLLGTLVDSSLVRQQDRHGSATFSMLATVREYGIERLEADGCLDRIRAAHAHFYVRLGARVERALEGATQIEWLSRLADERENVRAAIRYLLDTSDWDTATRFAWTLYIYWWAGGQLGEVRGWMEEVLAAREPVAGLTRAIALYFTRAIGFWQRTSDDVIPALAESAELFQREGEASAEALALISLALAVLAAPRPDPEYAERNLERGLRLFREAHDGWGEAMALVTLGRVALDRQDTQTAKERFEESLECARRQRDELATAIALYHLGWARLALGDTERARFAFEENLTISSRLGHDDGVAYGLEGLVAIAAVTGEPARAGRLLGAAETLRARTGLYTGPAFSYHQRYVDPILCTGEASEFEAARTVGRALPIREAVTDALSRP